VGLLGFDSHSWSASGDWRVNGDGIEEWISVSRDEIEELLD